MAIVLAAASVLPLNLDSIVIQEDRPLGIVGHFVIIAEDPDRIRYIQSDNIILSAGLDVLGDKIFGAQGGSVFNRIHLSGDAQAGTFTATPSSLFTNTGPITGTHSRTDTAETTADCGTVGTTCEEIKGAATQVDVDDATEIKSVALADQVPNFLAWSDLSPTLQVTPGTTTVTITYKVQLG